MFRNFLDVLLEFVREERGNQALPFYRRELGTHCISSSALIVVDSKFEASVMQIREGMPQQLPKDEKAGAKKHENSKANESSE